MVSRIDRRRVLLWVLLAIPALLTAARHLLLADAPLAELLHPTGEWSARLLILALALTPFSMIVPGSSFVRWLLRQRRAIGVAAFFYALAHLILYVVDMGTIALMLDEIGALGIWTAWVAFLLMLAAALVSNDPAMRALGRSWKQIQRLAYPAALFTLAHWMFVHGGTMAALANFAPLIVLQAVRMTILVRRSFKSPTFKETY